MKTEINLNIYAGTVRGGIISTQCTNNEKPKYVSQTNVEEVTALAWGRFDDEIVVGLSDGTVKLYHTELASFTQDITNYLEAPVVGIACKDDKIITGKSDGVVNIWNSKDKTDEKIQLKLNGAEKGVMNCFVENTNRSMVFATGGYKNDYVVWDLDHQNPIFKAKSLGHDELNLPFPSTIRGICTFPLEDRLGACVTKEGNVLLYDERAQRKHVTKYHEAKASFTCISTAYRERQCLVGTTKGYMQLIDLRSNKCLKTFQSFTGSVTSIACDAMSPYIATTSLDRHLRVHNIETKELLHKVYMKMSLTKILTKPIIKEEKVDEEPVETENVDEEYEELFENMETVVEKTPKKRKIKEKVRSAKKLNKKEIE